MASIKTLTTTDAKITMLNHIFEQGGWTIEEIHWIVEFGKDESIDPHERVEALAMGIHTHLERQSFTSYVLDAMEYAICDPRVTDEEAEAYYTFREATCKREELF